MLPISACANVGPRLSQWQRLACGAALAHFTALGANGIGFRFARQWFH
jgi:hypothetical protein